MTISRPTPIVLGTLAILASGFFALEVSAAHDVRARGGAERTTDLARSPAPSAPPASVTPTPTPLSPRPSGGITNVTIGEVVSGGNVGGEVTTGDEEVHVQVVNKGPVNNTTSMVLTTGGQTTPPPREDPQCEGERGRTVCAANDPGRGR